MAWFRRGAPQIDKAELSELVADAVKAALPAPQMAGSSQQYTELPREGGEFGAGFPFTPGVPLSPYSIDPREPNAPRPAPRRSEFTQSVNLQVSSTRLLPFPVLRDAGERIDVMRRCIEVRKAQMLSLDWDIVLTRQALKQIQISDEGVSSPGQASRVAREKFEPKMAELRTWWEKPDRFNSMDFSTWLSVLMEEQLVTDAVSVWPRRNLGGDVIAFEILDGSTIKPLLDHRGATPTPPNPAYQQVLYGFPRGEFVASDTGDVADGYLADQLVYRPRWRRTWTPYGSPPTEQALAAADVYLKRMAWIRGEFTDGTTPDTWLTLPDGAKMTPANIRDYETVINAELVGQLAERRALRVLPPGVTPKEMANFGEKYNPDLDEFLIKLICMCYDVMPTEVGFPPKSGIGGKGHQEGEANSAQRKAVRPTAVWLGDLLTDLSRQFLGMPPELEFKLLGYEIEDQNTQETVTDSQARRGGITLNDDRAARGLPLYDFPEADTPFIVTGSGLVFLPGALAAQTAGAELKAPAPIAEADTAEPAPPVSATDPRPTEETPAVGDPVSPGEPVPDGFIAVAGHLRRKAGATAEAAKFLDFARKRVGRAWRDFEFEQIDAGEGQILNVLGKAGRLDIIREHLAADVGKARARIVSRATKDKLIEEHGPKIGSAVAGLFPAPSQLIGDLDDGDDAETLVDDSLSDDFDDLDTSIEEYVKAGHQAAWDAAWLDGDPDDPDGADGLPGRLSKLLDSVPGLRDAVIATATGLVVDALRSHDPETNVAGVLDDQQFATDFAGVELTAALSAGTLDSAERQQIAYVQFTTGAGECSFCDDFDGRIMTLDEDSGMPPIHRGCQCSVEPLD